jgi:hypothetical protein
MTINDSEANDDIMTREAQMTMNEAQLMTIVVIFRRY